MKKMKNDPGMLEEYDFRGGVRGKYAGRYAEGTNVVVIDPDRSLAAIIRRKRRAERPSAGEPPR
jgi:hypothetical protein